MKGLLVKDVLYIRQTWGLLFAHSVFMSLMGVINAAVSGKVDTFFGIVLAGVFCILPMMVIADDRRTGYEKIMAYSPISKDDMVKARYLLMVTADTVGCLMVLLILGIGAWIGSAPIKELLVAAMMFMVTALVVPSVCLPLIYYFFKRSNTVIGISMISALMLIVASSLMFMRSQDISFSAAAVMFVTALVMTAVSCVISVRIFRKTDI